VARTGPPDFIGVGVQRCGTTWWFRTLLRHPQIKAAGKRQKELHYFDRFATREMTAADIAAYHELFPRKEGRIIGEWTPRYIADVVALRLIQRAAPDARLLVMLRDPIERFRSGFLHQLRRFPQRRHEMIAADAIERGYYATQLERLYKLFPAEQVLVLQYERCRQDPVEQYQRTLRFLGLPDDDEPRAVERERGKPTSPAKQPLWPDMAEALTRTFEPEVERLLALVPELDVALWPPFAHLAASRA
jgi:Sulfotransferase domain